MTYLVKMLTEGKWKKEWTAQERSYDYQLRPYDKLFLFLMGPFPPKPYMKNTDRYVTGLISPHSEMEQMRLCVLLFGGHKLFIWIIRTFPWCLSLKTQSVVNMKPGKSHKEKKVSVWYLFCWFPPMEIMWVWLSSSTKTHCF